MSKLIDISKSIPVATHTGNVSVPKIIMNNTINLFLKTAISILLISNHNKFPSAVCQNRFRILYLKKIYLYFSIGNGQAREPAPC